MNLITLVRFSWVGIDSCFCCAAASAVCMPTGKLAKRNWYSPNLAVQPSGLDIIV